MRSFAVFLHRLSLLNLSDLNLQPSSAADAGLTGLHGDLEKVVVFEKIYSIVSQCLFSRLIVVSCSCLTLLFLPTSSHDLNFACVGDSMFP